MWKNEEKNCNNNIPTKIIKSSDIGPVTMNNPGAIYKSRPLSKMIHSVMSCFKEFKKSVYKFRTDKRKFEDLVKVNDDNGQIIKRKKLCGNEINDYVTLELEFDIDIYKP
ncbi:unnamed protein product [Rhizophagus irregularis]|nr:unnamed protein product [Rhizophagus irregularis]